MVASRQHVVYRGEQSNERCVSVGEALEVGQRLFTLPGLPLLRAIKAKTIDRATTNLRIADQAVTVRTIGCTPEHESYDPDTAVVAVDCPADEAQRCGACVLRCDGGDEILRSIVTTSRSEYPL
jgi:hypothetical protein